MDNVKYNSYYIEKIKTDVYLVISSDMAFFIGASWTCGGSQALVCSCGVCEGRNYLKPLGQWKKAKNMIQYIQEGGDIYD